MSKTEHDETEPQETNAGRATEADEKGGKDPARQQAERDWQDSSKESGE